MQRTLISKKWFTALLPILLLLSACSGSGGGTKNDGAGPAKTDSAPNAPKKETLVVAITADPTTLDGNQVADNATIRATAYLYDRLVQESLDGQKIEPSLATAHTVSDDGKTYTFTLRPNVKFHDGTPLDAEAVKFSFDRQLVDGHPGAFEGAKFTMAGLWLKPIVDKVTVKDPLTVEVTLKEARPSFLRYISSQAGWIVSPKAVKEKGKDFAVSPVGSGPFKFVKWDRGQQLVLEANPDYWDGAPKFKTLILQTIKDAQSRLTALKSGQVDLMYDPLPDMVQTLKSDATVAVDEMVGRHIWNIAMNQNFAPFKDPRVRQAVNYAIDREGLTRDVLAGTGAPAKGVLSVSGWGPPANPNVAGYPYNPDKAKQLLKDAGFADGFAVTWTVPVSGSGTQIPKEMATYIADNLNKVDIKVKLQTVEWGENLTRHGGKDFEMITRPYGILINDPDFQLWLMFHSKGGLNFQNHNDAELDQWLDKGRYGATEKDRNEAWHKVQELMQANPPWAPIDHEISYVVRKANLKETGMAANFAVYLHKAAFQ